MAEWDDLGMTKEEYDAAMDGYHAWMSETGQLDAPSDDDIARMAAEMGVDEVSQPTVSARDHVETPAEYSRRMRNEAAWFRHMSFEEVLHYRVDKKMTFTDADRKLVNQKILDEYGEMSEEYQSAMEIFDSDEAMADVCVDTYANSPEAQREVAACGGNVPAWMVGTPEFPVDEHGRAYTADEIRDQIAEKRAQHTEAYEAAQEKFFDRVYNFHVLTTKPNVFPSEVTGGKTAVPTITPATFRELGDAYSQYSATRAISDVRQMVGSQQISGLPVVDYTKKMTVPVAEPAKEVQADVQIATELPKSQHVSDVGPKFVVPDGHDVGGRKSRDGVAGFGEYDNGPNGGQGGRSNPDYDFEEYD